MKPLRMTIWIDDALYDALIKGAQQEHRSLAKQVVCLLTDTVYNVPTLAIVSDEAERDSSAEAAHA